MNVYNIPSNYNFIKTLANWLKKHYNNEISEYIESKKNIKSFFTNPDIVNLIVKERRKEFELLEYSKDVNDICI